MKKNVFAGIWLSLISGVLLILSFTPWSVSWLAWVSLVPLFVAALAFAPSRAAFGAYFGITVAFALTGMIYGMPPGYAFAYALPLLAFVLIFVITFLLKDALMRDNYRYFTVITVTGIVGTEFVRSFLPTSYFAAMGLTQYNQPAAIQIAWLFGVGGVSFLVVTVNCAVALAIVNLKNLSRVKTQLIVDVVIVAALMGANIFLLKQPLPEKGRVRVAAVQFGYVPEAVSHPAKLKRWATLQASKDWPGMTRETINLLEPLTRKAVRGGARLVVWPETMLSVNPNRYPDIRKRLSKLADDLNVYLVTPYYEVLPGHENEEAPPYKNMAAVFAPDGALIHLYHKQQYVRMVGIEKGPSGHKTEAFDTAIGRLALMICYDADYPHIPAKFARRGGEVFIEPSHDLALFLTRHHPAMQMFRTVENHRALVKSDYVQGTLIVDPKGHILADPPDGLQVVSAQVPLVSAPTLQPVPQYVFGGACAALFMLISVVAAKKRRD